MHPPVALFAVTGEARPDTLSRVVGLLAQLGLTPLRVSMRRDGDIATIKIAQDGLGDLRAAIVAEKMRAIVSIAGVTLEWMGGEGPDNDA